MAGDRPLLQRVFLDEQGVLRASSRNATGQALPRGTHPQPLQGGELTYPPNDAFLKIET
jgi:hypothetical protein